MSPKSLSIIWKVVDIRRGFRHHDAFRWTAGLLNDHRVMASIWR